MPSMTTLDIKSVIEQIPESRRALAVNLHMLTTSYCSATQLADGIGKHSSEVSHWIRGRRNPGIDTLHRIAEFFGIELHELLSPELSHLVDSGDIKITMPAILEKITE